MVDLYKITNTINNKKYIGVATGGYKSRWSGHKHYAYKIKENTLLCRALRKYGEEAFKVERIACVEKKDDAYYMEQYYIKKYKTFYKDKDAHGYNMTKGGIGALGSNMRAVVQIDLKGDFVNEFESIAQAVKETGVASNSIWASASIYGRLEGRITRGKWRWAYKEDFEKEMNENRK